MRNTSKSLLDYIHVMVGVCRDDHDDTQLLSQFVESRDERAFTTLLWRHGPLVWRTCTRVLGDGPDAEDAFQAAFLALARKAGQLRGDTLAGWLHHVARQTALKADAGARRRRGLEQRLQSVTQPRAEGPLGRTEVYAALDEELVGLPERLRVPLVLRYLESKTLEEVARIMGCSRRDLGRRLVRGEAILRKRLERRGLSVGIVSIAMLLGGTAGAPAMPALLIGSTARAALRSLSFPPLFESSMSTDLAEGVMQTMLVTKTKLVTVLVGLTLCLAGGGLLAYQALAGNTAEPLQPASETRGETRVPRQPRAAAYLDCYGDPLPAGAMARMGTTRLWNGYENTSWSSSALAFSPDGKTLAAQGLGGTVCLWEAVTGKEIRRLTDAGKFVAISPDGQTLVTAMSNERDIRLWEAATGKFLRELEYQGPKGQEEHLLEVTFLPNDKILAVREFRNAAGEWRMCWWDVVTGKEIGQVKRDGRSSAVTFSPDGKMLAAPEGGGDIIHLWEVATGKEIRQLTKGHQKGIDTMAFSSDGKMLASGDSEKICVWEIVTGKQIHRLNTEDNNGGWCSPIVFSPDCKTLVGGRTGHRWDVITGKELRSFDWAEPDGGNAVRLAAFSPDGKIVATGEPEGVIRLWETATCKEISPRKGHQGAIHSLAYSPDGKTLVSGSRDRTIGLWEAATGKEIRRSPRHEIWSVHSVAYSPDSKTLASTDCGICYLWEAATVKKIRQFPNPGPVNVFSPNSKILATGKAMMGSSVAVSLWDVATGKEIHCLPTDQDANMGSWSVAFSPDGRMLAATGKHDTVGLWETATGKPIGQLNLGEQKKDDHRGTWSRMVLSFAFSPDGRMLAAAMWDGNTAGLWEVASGKKIHQLKGLKTQLNNTSGWSFSFSPDGKMVAAAGGEDRKVHLWEVAAGKEISQLKGHRSAVRTVVFSPDGKTLASGSNDTTCLIWDITSFAARLKPVQAPSRPFQPLSLEQLETAWTDLAKDPAKAYAAIRLLQTRPTQALALLQARIQPVAPLANPQQLKRWIAGLDDSSFTVRDKARREIEKLGEIAIPALRQALQGQPVLEVKRRLQDLLAELEPQQIVVSPKRLRELRAVQVLEYVATAESRQVLQTWAKGVAEANLTREAQAALARLAKRSAVRP